MTFPRFRSIYFLFCATLLMCTVAPAQLFTQQGSKLVGSGAINDQHYGAEQGYSVALSADGNTALVGGYEDNSGTGAAWVFTRDNNGNWSQQGSKLVAADGVGHTYQGWSVALSADGNTALVGGYGDNTYIGAAWAYTRNSNGTWTQQGSKLVGTGGVGFTYQGWSVALSSNGNTALLGGYGDNTSVGAVWAFTRDSNGNWTQQGSKLVGTGAVGAAEQGNSVAVSGDGNTALEGGWADNAYTGAVWVFTRDSTGNWIQQGGKLIGSGAVGPAYQGCSVALSGDGNRALVGGYADNGYVGALWIFAQDGSGQWTQQGSKLVGTESVGESLQGYSVALSGDGNTALAGGPLDNGNVGAVWVYSRGSNGNWSQQGSKMVGSGAAGAADQGDSVALSADGDEGVVGGRGDNGAAGAVWPFVRALSEPLQFVPVTPCRVVDTRNAIGPFGGPELAAGASRAFPISTGACSIPSTATAYSLNITVIPDAQLGYLTVWPTGQSQPLVSVLNSDGRIKANAAIVPAGSDGSINVFASNSTHLVVDIEGYFVPAASSTLAFYPLTPCRVADTRSSTGRLGESYISGGTARVVSILSSSCSVPSTAQAYSLNFTAVPHGALGYLTAWPTGQPQPLVSALNALTGAVTANAAIVPAGSSGEISVYASNDTDLVIDINGYFAAPGTGGLSLYTLTPCRALDTRTSSGEFSGTLGNVAANSCSALASTAQVFVLNATVVPATPLGYLTLWPNSAAEPGVSTLNALDGAVTSNLAIVPTTNGLINAFASNVTHLILDVSGFFAP